MQTTFSKEPIEQLSVQKRIGSTVYEVNVYFNPGCMGEQQSGFCSAASPDAKETMNDKIMRLVRNEIQSGKVAV